MGLWKSIIMCLHILRSALQVAQHGLTAQLPNNRPAPQPTPSHTWIKVSDMIIREARWCRWWERQDRGDRRADMVNRRSVVEIIGRGFLNDANSHLRYRTPFFERSYVVRFNACPSVWFISEHFLFSLSGENNLSWVYAECLHCGWPVCMYTIKTLYL